MGSDESHFNVSLIVRDKVTRQCPQTTTFEEKGELKRIQTKVPQLIFVCYCLMLVICYLIIAKLWLMIDQGCVMIQIAKSWHMTDIIWLMMIRIWPE